MSRLHGNTLPTLTFKNGTSSAVDLGSYVASFENADGDGQNTTMGDWAAGNAPKAVNITFVLDLVANGAWDYFYANRGSSTVVMTFVPDSASSVSATNRKFTATVQMPYGVPNFATAQGASTDDQTFDVTVQCGSTLVPSTT